MSFAPYSELADSGVKWLGDLPNHWRVKKIGHVADLITGFAFPSDGFSFDDSDSTIPLVRGESVSEGFLRWGERGRYWPKDSPYEERYLLDADDIVVQMDGSKVGKNWAFITEGDLPLLLVQRVTRIRCREVIPRFAFALVANEMFVRYVDQAKTDPAVPHITMRNIADYWIPIPPEDEQTAISSFLDVETSKIDGLVSEQRRLIELLQEKRQAVISHAVTKGLNPNAPMKPSGIQWLGDVPQHWGRTRLKFNLHALIDTEHKTVPFFDDGEYLVVRTNNVRNGKLVMDGSKFTNLAGYEEWTRRGKPEPGDIIFTREAPAGEAFIVPDGIDLCLGQRTVLMKIDHERLHSRFALWSLYGGLATALSRTYHKVQPSFTSTWATFATFR